MITYKVTVDEEGTVKWYNENGQLHREDGPAVEYADGGRQWYLNDQLHREDGPAIEWANGTVEWWLHGVKYPPTGPIMLKYNEQKKSFDMAESSTRL